MLVCISWKYAMASAKKCGQLHVIAKAHIWVLFILLVYTQPSWEALKKSVKKSLLPEEGEEKMTNPKYKKVAQYPTVSKEPIL